jgi:streptomycin 6-kinase
VTGPLELPVNLVESAARDRHDRRRAWIADLPRVVGSLAQRWSLQLGTPFQPGGEGSWTAPARDAAGRDLVLKVGWTHDEALHEPDGLRLWAGTGAVLLCEEWSEGDTSALLMERARPGEELGRSLPGEQQDTVIASLLRRMRVPPPEGHPFRPLAEMCAAWADEAEETPSAVLDPGLFRTGLELFRTLPTDAAPAAVLLTDLHGGNVLSAQREPWLVIDPKPYVGDPAYDPLQHLFNCQERLAADPPALADRMADLCGVDRERFRMWLFARWVVESSWAAPGDVDLLVRVATRLAP